MFATSSAFDKDISGWDFNGVTSVAGFCGAGSMSQANYDLLLVSLDAQTLTSGLTLDMGTTQYSAGAPATARASIISGDSWTINDGGQV